MIKILVTSLKIQRPITLVNKCGAIYDEGVLVEAMLWYSDKPIQSIKNVTMHGKYACVSIGKTKIHIHRLLGLYLNNNKECKSNIHFHHKNGNKLDNRVENIEKIDAKQHISIHNKGKKPSRALIEATIRTNHSRKGKRAKPHRPDITPMMVFKLRQDGLSFRQISLKLNLDWGCVKQRFEDAIHDTPELLKTETL